jgi:hypothetical protein
MARKRLMQGTWFLARTLLLASALVLTMLHPAIAAPDHQQVLKQHQLFVSINKRTMTVALMWRHRLQQWHDTSEEL